MNPIIRFLSELQDVSLLIWRAFVSLFSRPRYYYETIKQMDMIGVGSLPIILLTGFFTGGVLVLQVFPTLQYYSIQNEAGNSVATSLIRELGPVLSALMVSGRIGAAISAVAALVLGSIAYFHPEEGVGMFAPFAALLFLGYVFKFFKLRRQGR